MLSIYRKTMGFHSSDKYENMGGSAITDNDENTKKNENQKENEKDQDIIKYKKLRGSEILSIYVVFFASLYYVYYEWYVTSKCSSVTAKIFAGAFSVFFDYLIILFAWYNFKDDKNKKIIGC